MKVRVRIPVQREISYEVEVEDVAELTAERLGDVHKAVLEALEGIRKRAAAVTVADLEGWLDLTGEVPHVSRLARDLPLKDQILLAYYAWELKGRRAMKPIEVYEFLRNDGFPVNYGSVVARLAELAKDGLLVRDPEGTYRLSRFGTERVAALTSQKPM
ncbi:MAG: hypothetical protein NZ988_00895 [Thaumarchaeota archaeon]|nr:hypothetical protein [Candidatus Calditenuaceae archaeon]MDW8186590.1 hypothetical protein [Nitrososphaerota archaeon]